MAHHLSVLISQYSPLCSLSPRCSCDPSDQPGSPPLLGLCTCCPLTAVFPSSDSSPFLVFAHCHPLGEAFPSLIQNVNHHPPPKKKYQLSTLYLLSLLYFFSLVLVLTDSRFYLFSLTVDCLPHQNLSSTKAGIFVYCHRCSRIVSEHCLAHNRYSVNE